MNWRAPAPNGQWQAVWLEVRLTNISDQPLKDPKVICDTYNAAGLLIGSGIWRWEGVLRPGRYKTYLVWVPEFGIPAQTSDCYLTTY